MADMRLLVPVPVSDGCLLVWKPAMIGTLIPQVLMHSKYHLFLTSDPQLAKDFPRVEAQRMGSRKTFWVDSL
jgi:hypothetical protein